jgi:uncharacterized protein (TIGR02466 family)
MLKNHMAKIEKWFPTTVYLESDLFSPDQNLLWQTHVLEIQKSTPTGGDEWEGQTYTTHNTSYDILKDTSFQPLIAAVTYHVDQYVKAHNSIKTYNCDSAWLNISTKGNFQEMHTHNESTISAVYYIAAPQGSGRIVFEDPREPDMLPIKNIPDRNELSYSKVGYTAEAGTLVIFRSYVRHMVTINENIDPRISVAFNF